MTACLTPIRACLRSARPSGTSSRGHGVADEGSPFGDREQRLGVNHLRLWSPLLLPASDVTSSIIHLASRSSPFPVKSCSRRFGFFLAFIFFTLTPSRPKECLGIECFLAKLSSWPVDPFSSLRQTAAEPPVAAVQQIATTGRVLLSERQRISGAAPNQSHAKPLAGTPLVSGRATVWTSRQTRPAMCSVAGRYPDAWLVGAIVLRLANSAIPAPSAPGLANAGITYDRKLGSAHDTFPSTPRVSLLDSAPP